MATEAARAATEGEGQGAKKAGSRASETMLASTSAEVLRGSARGARRSACGR